MLTQEQHEDRKKGVGGSDAAVILGVSKWQTPVELYLEKIGQGTPRPQTDPMAVGHWFEDGIAEQAAIRLGLRVRRRRKQIVHKKYPWMRAHLDRDVIGEPAIMEVKTTAFHNEDWGEDGTDQIPKPYLAQVAHYMAVKDAEVAYVPVLFTMSRNLAIYEVRRSLELEQILIDAEATFWNEHVVKRIPPPPLTVEDYGRLWPQDNGQALYAGADDLEAIAALRAVKDEEKAVKERKTALEAQLKERLGEHQALHNAAQQPLVTWKTGKPTTKIDWEGAARFMFIRWGEDIGLDATKGESVESFVKREGFTQEEPGSRTFLLKPPPKK